MKEHYTIGETARLLGVSAQTLRYYDREGILKPICTDEQTGYRYYSYEQFHIIDRIRYLQNFGLSLEEIESVIREGTVDRLLPLLASRKKQLLDEIQDKAELVKDIDWYIEYFSFAEKGHKYSMFYRTHEKERYILEVPCFEDDRLRDMEIRLAERKGSPANQDLSWRRQYGYRLRLQDLLEGRFLPQSYFIYTKKPPDKSHPDIRVIPEGDFICFRTPILKQSWNTEMLSAYLNGYRHLPMAGQVFALEFEDNLIDWSDAVYEVQIAI